MTGFNKGDRVEYDKFGGYYGNAQLHGWKGTVTGTSNNYVLVRWDNDGLEHCHNLNYLKKIPNAVTVFVKGDRVRFTGKHPSGDFRNDNRIGAVGTVKGTMPGVVDPTLTLITVDWDHRDTNSHYPENLEKVEVNTMNVQNVFGDGFASYLKDATSDPDPVEVLREQADKADEIAEAFSDFAEKLRAAADAFDAINNLTNDNL